MGLGGGDLMADVSIIIPTLHSPMLAATLHAACNQSAFDSVLEIIVVGQQENVDFARLPKVVFVPVQEKPSPARNRNIGARVARGDWLCFTDADCVPNSDWIEQIRHVCATGVASIGGAVAIAPEASYWGMCDHLLGFESQVAGLASASHIRFAATLNFCIRRDLFDALGGFDEEFRGAAGEDLDFCRRLYRAGYQITFAPHAVVQHHPPRQDFLSVWKHLYGYGEATVQLRLKQKRDLVWRVAENLVRLPAVGECIGLGRVLLRAILRPLRRPGLLRYSWALPGMAVLDWAHTLSMIRAIRSHDS